jgi:hypothetical protein
MSDDEVGETPISLPGAFKEGSPDQETIPDTNSHPNPHQDRPRAPAAKMAGVTQAINLDKDVIPTAIGPSQT